MPSQARGRRELVQGILHSRGQAPRQIHPQFSNNETINGSTHAKLIETFLWNNIDEDRHSLQHVLAKIDDCFYTDVFRRNSLSLQCFRPLFLLFLFLFLTEFAGFRSGRLKKVHVAPTCISQPQP